MSRPPVVAVEGLPFVGKTSGLQAAVDRLPHWLAIAEYHDLLDRDDVGEFATKPGSADTQAERIATYFRLDLRRWAQASTARASGQPVVFDRFHLSITTYSQALYHCFGIGNPTEVATRYLQAITDPTCPIECPDVVVFAEVDLSTALARLDAHSTTIGTDFTVPDFVAQLVENYAEAIASIDRPVHRIDATKPLDHVHDRIHHILQGLS